ncbi:hypothetical protein ACFPYJ_06665 [Paenibacillus solisilvae]|uniref:Uncharacterized protein n=1 Tax=Paenibacillus solisilvae TaxID=2486751 RepID=A0ABW0VU87_9BACL
MDQEYVAIQSSNNEIDVNPASKSNYQSTAQLQAYKHTTETLPVTITMEQALSLNEFEAFVSRYGVMVEGYQLRQLEQLPDGTYDRITLMASPKRGKLIPEGLSELRESPNFIGVIAIYGNLPGQAYERTSNDKNVFTADITAQLLKEELQGNRQIEDMVSSRKVTIDVNVPNLYWELEDAGIVQYDEAIN